MKTTYKLQVVSEEVQMKKWLTSRHIGVYIDTLNTNIWRVGMIEEEDLKEFESLFKNRFIDLPHSKMQTGTPPDLGKSYKYHVYVKNPTNFIYLKDEHKWIGVEVFPKLWWYELTQLTNQFKTVVNENPFNVFDTTELIVKFQCEERSKDFKKLLAAKGVAFR